MSFRAPYITYEEVGQYAESFLKKHNSTRQLPVPIEWIIENDLGMHIIPIANLYKYYKQSGFLSADRKKIIIDEYQYDNYYEKYRFTLAHEVGHLIMHGAIYDELSFSSVEEYMEFLFSIPQKELYWFETHGDQFAGHLLVPSIELEKYCVELLESNRDQFSDTEYLPQEFWSYASNALANTFEVSPIVVDIRIKYERFSDKFADYYKRT